MLTITGVAELQYALNTTPREVQIGAKSGIEQGLKKWQTSAQKIALRKTGKLRAGIKPDGVKGAGLDLEGTLVSNAYNQGFNYALYWHLYGTPKNFTTSGTTGKHLEKSGIAEGDNIVREIEQEVHKAYARRVGNGCC
jgi:hypothetical protein